ncbi:MAG: DUF1501 domain-containing protein [Myxococcaceae bacterium]|nr:DUF1501 domain-containing protein [Myxococcaceae bacterium]
MSRNSVKNTLQRRTFLKAASAFAGTSLFGGLSFKAFAQQAQALAPADHCFVFAYFGGGWDALLNLDPRDPNEFTPERISETRILPGYSLLANDPTYPTMPIQRQGSNIAFGPAVGRFADHFDVMSVVRGINMNTVAHEVGFRYFLTGKEPNGSAARNSSTATEVVGQLYPKMAANQRPPVPNLAFNIESYNDRYGGYANALRVSSANDLLLTLAPSPTAIDSEIEKQLIDMRGQPVTCESQLYDSRGLVTQYNDARKQVRTVLDASLDRYFRFDQTTGDPPAVAMEKAATVARYQLRVGNNGFTNDPRNSSAARAALVATALKKGVSQCVSMNIAGGLDTHFGTQLTQANNQRAGWNALADLIADFKESDHPAGDKWIKHVTILVFSEFSRTPLINASGGRDHHITNCCAIVGRGVKHNFVFGASGNVGMSAGVVNYDTGRPDRKGFQYLPDHVVATIMASAGLDYSIMRVEPLKGLMAT